MVDDFEKCRGACWDVVFSNRYSTFANRLRGVLDVKIEQLYRNIVLEEISNESMLKIYENCLEETIQQRVKWMISGIESIEMNDGLMINGYHSMSADEEVYNKYKNIEVSVERYLVYDLVGHTGEYRIQYIDDLIEVEQEILGEAGLSNMFTTKILILLDGEIKRYSVMNQEGIVVTKTQMECMSSKEVCKLQIVWENRWWI